MARAVMILLVLLGLTAWLLGSVGDDRPTAVGGDPSNPQTPFTTDDHLHTHQGPFAHGHRHDDFPDGETHSHPHEHRHQHRSDELLEEKGWIQVGHQHNVQQTAFYVRCRRRQSELQLEFLISQSSGEAKLFQPQEKILGQAYIGAQPVAPVRFQRHEEQYVALTNRETTLDHPLLSIGLLQVPIGDEVIDLNIPVR